MVMLTKPTYMQAYLEGATRGHLFLMVVHACIHAHTQIVCGRQGTTFWHQFSFHLTYDIVLSLHTLDYPTHKEFPGDSPASASSLTAEVLGLQMCTIPSCFICGKYLYLPSTLLSLYFICTAWWHML